MIPHPYKNLMGGDGMQIEIDYRDNNTIYTQQILRDS